MRDGDCLTVQEALIGRDPTLLEWERVPALAALKRIEMRLAAGKAHAEIVEACVEAGHVKSAAPEFGAGGGPPDPSGLGSAALGFAQMRVPKDEHEAFEMLLFWTRNTVAQIEKVSADGWSPEGALAYARGDLRSVLSYVDRMEVDRGPRRPGS